MVTSGPSPDSGEAALAPPANPPLRSAASEPPAPLPPPEPAALRPPAPHPPEQRPLATVIQVAAQLLYAALVVAGLYYCFVTPRPHYRHAIRLQAPVDAAHQVTLRLSDARLVQQDRALALLPRIPVKTAVPMAAPAEAPLRVVVRNNLASAEIYHRLRELPPAEKLALEVVLPQQLREVTVQPGWVLEVDTTSDYARLALRRVAVVLPLLLLPLLLLRLWRRRRAA